MKLSGLPLVMPIAQWIWAADDNNDIANSEIASDDLAAHSNILATATTAASPEQCLSYLETFSVADFIETCLSQAISRLSGIGIIVGACFNKAPTIFNMLEAQSAQGFSRMSLYMECLFYANSSFYSLHHQHPFTAYGENLVLLIQTIVMVYLLWHFSNQKDQQTLADAAVTTREKILVGVLSILYSGVAIYLLPPDWYYILHAFNDVIIVYSGGLQVRETYRIQHTGAQSIATTSMNLVGEVLRIFTTIEETGGDFNMLLSYGLCVVLSITMFGQYFWYYSNTQHFYAQQQQQQQAAKLKKSE